jgi:hypothetical protein
MPLFVVYKFKNSFFTGIQVCSSFRIKMKLRKALEEFSIMSSNLQVILQQAEQLPPEEQLELIRQLAERLKSEQIKVEPKRHWQELRGIASEFLAGKDAQEWVNGLREEWDERESHLWGQK